ncbi:MAG TPA: sulfotransferase [Gemmatimonadales bacterium]
MLPNFIVIGAAKAGTTALYWYLAEHPDVFMSPVKETNFFAYGVDQQGRLLWGNPDVHRFPIKSLSEYEALFAEAGGAAAVGEASTMYLECPQAAGRIRALIPEARIICALRHPVDRAYSDYQMYLRNRGRRLQPERDLAAGAAWASPDSHWMRIGRYHDPLSRYFEAFPRDHVHVFLFDDLKREALRVVQDLYRFLGVEPEFVPDFDTPHNVGGMPASPMLERLLVKSPLKTVLEPLVPQGATNWLRRLRTRTMRQAPSLPAPLRAELTRSFHDDIAATSRLIGRDLAHWL